ncbi:hypothetical protein [Ekhidna sp. To15]|uniref:hypothetical protein n=1 Tax=Ekhidna sp. To15 TaxID=3395267 RepID=UPI003F521935
MKKYIFPLIVLAVFFSACGPDDPGFESVDVASIDSVYNVVSGETTVVAGTNNDFAVRNRQGSTYEFAVIDYNATFESGTYPFIGTGTFEYTDTGTSVEATVEVTETTSWGVSETFTYDILVVPYSNSFTPMNMYSGTTQTLSLDNVYGGSTYSWSISGAANASLSATKGSEVDIVTTAKDSDGMATVTVVETTATGDVNEYSFDINIYAYCAYDLSPIDGTVFDVLENDLTYGNTYGSHYQSNAAFTYDGNSIIVNGLNSTWMVDFWGETINVQNPITIDADDLDLILTIEEQVIMETTYDDAPYTYTIDGTGLVDGCNGTLTLEWNLCSVEGGYCFPFKMEGELPRE